VEVPAPPVRFGVVGCADIAWRRTLPTLVASPDARLAAIASRNATKAARFAAEFDCSSTLGYDSLLESPDIDAVYVPLPTMLATEWIEKALLAGKHVLAEKPLTAATESTVRLLRLARTNRLVLLENVAFMHHAQHAAVLELLDKGAIGELRDFSSAFTIPPLPSGNIRYQPNVGGGALLDMGIYPIRAALRFLGHGIEVVGAVLRQQAQTGAVVSGRILGYTQRGIAIDLSFGMQHSYRSSYEFAGSTGRLMLDRAFTPSATHQPVIRVERQDHREQITLPADDQLANVIAFFARAVRTANAQGPFAAEGSFAVASLRQAELVDVVQEMAVRITV